MLVKLKNVGERPYTLTHAKHEPKGFTINPGRERITHFDVAALYLGNPAAVNMGESVDKRFRDAELGRIQVLWGFYAGLAPDSDWADTACPRIECHTLDDEGNTTRMWMVHDDPIGNHFGEAAVPEPGVLELPPAVAAQLAEQRSEIRELRDMVAALVAAGVNTGDDLPAPLPEPGSVEAKLADALVPDQTQAERNETRDDIPPPPAGEVAKDKPRAPKTGRRVGE